MYKISNGFRLSPYTTERRKGGDRLFKKVGYASVQRCFDLNKYPIQNRYVDSTTSLRPWCSNPTLFTTGMARKKIWSTGRTREITGEVTVKPQMLSRNFARERVEDFDQSLKKGINAWMSVGPLLTSTHEDDNGGDSSDRNPGSRNRHWNQHEMVIGGKEPNSFNWYFFPSARIDLLRARPQRVD